MDLNDDDDVDEERREEVESSFSTSHPLIITTYSIIKATTTTKTHKLWFDSRRRVLCSLPQINPFFPFPPLLILFEKTTMSERERERMINVWSVFVYMSLSLLWCMCVYVVWCLDRNLYHHVLVVVCVYNNRPRDINYIYARCRNNSSIFWIIHTNIKLSSTSASIFLPLLFIQTMCLFLTSI